MSPRPRLVFFDVMDTLVRDPFHDVMPSFLGMTLPELLRYKHPTAWVDFELGRIDERTFLDLFLPGRSFDAEGFCKVVRESYTLLPGIHELLTDLRRSAPDVRLYALSNYPPWYAWIAERCALDTLLDGAFVSYETGARKPDPEAYLVPCRRLAEQPEQALFIDDRDKNCEGARAVGMQAIEFDGAEKLREELARRGLVAP
ncbi:HAD family phosphatase [Polyangium sp. y55x31]|uniref:HAD family hydrolase n=1 Tax=Polyangium sp. y55x31 TaxID=3042688 RepID=UPI0024821232|nr:HAD family phosphatase [Polyangium sp. y55x31]MDI1475762.1 HAD family phosphatase [Polyangium sp. y55x31]